MQVDEPSGKFCPFRPTKIMETMETQLPPGFPIIQFKIGKFLVITNRDPTIIFPTYPQEKLIGKSKDGIKAGTGGRRRKKALENLIAFAALDNRPLDNGFSLVKKQYPALKTHVLKHGRQAAYRFKIRLPASTDQ